MTTRAPSALLLALLFASSAGAQAPMDDALWIAARFGRSLTKVDRCGAVLQTVDLTGNGFNLRGLSRAPDGKLWIVNFITPTFTICDRNGAILQNVSTTGNAFSIAFDRAGDAYVSLSNGTIGRYDAAGSFITTYSVPASPLGICVDNAGNVWCAHRTTPGQITKIVPSTATVTSFPVAGTMLPTRIAAESGGGGATPSRLWVIGDGSGDLEVFDNAGTSLTVFTLGGSGWSGLAIDRDDNVWVSSFGNGNVFLIDRTTGGTLQNFSDLPSAIDVTLDATGVLWVLNRVSFSGPQPAELRRYDVATPAMEIAAPVGLGAQWGNDAAGFAFASVVDPTGDADGDGDPNRLEVVTGTSPYDAQSNRVVHFGTAGRTQLGGNVVFDAQGTAPAQIAILFATGRGPAIPFPGLGNLLLDPATLLPLAPLVLPVPSVNNFNLPIDPTLVGVIEMQGVYVGAVAQFSNLACVRIYN